MWIDEFLALMTGSIIKLSTIDQAYRLKDKNLPEKIYKFRSFNNFSIENFENDSVWICSASKFNDPFECATTFSSQKLIPQFTKINFNKIFSKVNKKKYFSEIQIDAIKASADPMYAFTKQMIENHEDLSEENKEVIISELNDLMHVLFEKIINYSNEKTQNGMKICSFSSRVDSIVMWGHYANSHTGFAIEYDVKNWSYEDIRRRMLYPVIYRNELFDSTKYHLQAISGAEFNNLFTLIASIHKSPDWSYEREWRFVLPMGDSFPDQNYIIPSPSALYLGTRIKAEDKQRLAEIATKKMIPYYQMVQSTSEFKLIPVA